MQYNILNQDQKHLLPLLSKFKKEFYMVGGTSIALHIGHRLSIDFDLFKQGEIRPSKILSVFKQNNEEVQVTLNRNGQLNLVCRNVKFTFFEYDYLISHPVVLDNGITIPGLLDLAATKAFALGMRSKWKDYLDLYFIIKSHYSINEISKKASEYFGDLFSEKLFRGQLNYFVGVNYDEQVEFMPGFEVDEQEVKDFLTDAALTGF
jgi:Nucleotidyl transferase AbiEii toxin, Type IV TA system